MCRKIVQDVSRYFSKNTNNDQFFFILFTKRGHETQFLCNFLINLNKKDFWCVEDK